jgi:hypothetical protein
MDVKNKCKKKLSGIYNLNIERWENILKEEITEITITMHWQRQCEM